MLAGAVLGSGVALLDTTLVNVALPALERSLHTGIEGLQWVVDAYLLFLGALMLVGGALGDRFGRRRVFAIGLSFFGGASAVCAAAPTIEWLIAARALQGMGGALLVPGSLSLLRAVIREEDQGRAIGLWSGLSGVSTAVGPLAGGWLIEVAGWRVAFVINLPLVAVALWALLRSAPESRDARAPRSIDWPGALLATFGLGLMAFASIERRNVGLGLLGLVAFVGFVIVERRSAAPMLPMTLFRSPQFSGANAVTLGLYFALSGSVFFLMIELQRVAGYWPLAAGASLLPITVLLFLISPLAGRGIQRFGHRVFMTAGPIASAAGLAMLTRVGKDAAYWSGVFPGVVVLGLGVACTVAPLTEAALTAAPPEHAGVASGFNNAVARVAGLLAVALVPGAVGLPIGPKLSPDAFASGFARAMWVCAAAAAVSGGVAFASIDRS
ncbi:MAG: MFS transporter [Myxococcales bacterium]|nr:MFS transporter [Myxococcales bacterium]